MATLRPIVRRHRVNTEGHLIAAGEWDVDTKITKMTDEQHRALMHHPGIVAQITKIAHQIALAAGAGHSAGDFGVIVQNKHDTKRARAFALPTNNGGIHLELTQSLLLKAAGSAGHTNLKGEPPSEFETAATRDGDSEVSATGAIKAIE
jgi:hypothetical protein